MTPEQFCYWLQGRAELVSGPPKAEEWECIRQHLATVFTKVTPTGPAVPPTWVRPMPYPTPLDRAWPEKPFEVTC